METLKPSRHLKMNPESLNHESLAKSRLEPQHPECFFDQKTLTIASNSPLNRKKKPHIAFATTKALLCLTKILFVSKLLLGTMGTRRGFAQSTDKAALWEHLHHVGWIQTVPSVPC